MFKRIKRLLRLRNKSGFTLVEVIVACALLGVLVLGVLGFATPVLTSVRAKEQNARAVLLSESICNYIANSVQYAYYVQTIDMAAPNDTRAASGPAVANATYDPTTVTQGWRYVDEADKGLKNLFICKNSLSSKYELRCIGIRWLKVPGESTYKLMLTNEAVDQETGALDENNFQPVFESVFYDELYPVIKIQNYAGEVADLTEDEDDEAVDFLKDGKIAPALKIVTDIYITPECYSTTAAVREDAMLTFNGMTYTFFANIKSPQVNALGKFQIHPTISINDTYNDAYDAYKADSASAADINKDKYYYPNSFIYYIAFNPYG